MENKNANIFVSSVAKVSERLKYYGDTNLENISLLRLIYKYACYATSYAHLQTLDKMVSRLQREDNLICLEHQSSGIVSYSAPVGNVEVGGTNTRPTLSATSITVGEEDPQVVLLYLNYLQVETCFMMEYKLLQENYCMT